MFRNLSRLSRNLNSSAIPRQTTPQQSNKIEKLLTEIRDDVAYLRIVKEVRAESYTYLGAIAGAGGLAYFIGTSL